MISALKDLDARTARGILARMALWLDGAHNPSAKEELPDELDLRKKIENELTSRFGDSVSPEERDLRLLEALDAEIDALSTAPDPGTIIRLAMRGDAPSDLYNVRIIKNITDYCGKHAPVEEANIRECVAKADMEQHFGPTPENPGLKLISLFAKHFRSTDPQKSFLLLVAAKNEGLILDVHQAWRIYSDLVDYTEDDDLLHILIKFANAFGVNFEYKERQYKFLTNVVEVINGRFEHELKILPWFGRNGRGQRVEKPMQFMLSYFSEELSGGKTVAALVIAVNLTKYVSVVEKRGWDIN